MTTIATTVNASSTTPNYADLVAQLTAKQAALGDPRDVPNTPRAQEEFYSTQMAIARTISTLMNAGDLAVATSRLAAATAERDAWLAKQAELTAEIAAFKDWRLAGDARARDAEYERQRDLQRRLERLHRGTLYRTPGETFGTVDYLEERVTDLTTRAAAIRSRLDAAAAQAEALLGEKVTS